MRETICMCDKCGNVGMLVYPIVINDEHGSSEKIELCSSCCNEFHKMIKEFYKSKNELKNNYGNIYNFISKGKEAIL